MSVFLAGDLIKIERTLRVIDDGAFGLEAEDVRSGESYMIDRSGTVKFHVVKLAVRPTPKAGDILTGYQVRERMWKRGTVIQCVEGKYTPSPLLLQHDGQWADSEASLFEFEDLNDEAHFKLLHVAQ